MKAAKGNSKKKDASCAWQQIIADIRYVAVSQKGKLARKSFNTRTSQVNSHPMKTRDEKMTGTDRQHMTQDETQQLAIHKLCVHK